MNRLEWTLGIILVVLLVVVAVFSLLLWFRPSTTTMTAGSSGSGAVISAQADQIAPTSVFVGQTAKVAFAAAQQVAINWQSDAALLNASATWPQGARASDLQTGQTTWSFTFYSVQGGATALIAVVENEATLLSNGRFQNTTPILAAGGWQVDSEAVINQFLSQGGETFIQDNGVTTMTMMLSTSNETGRIEWFISLFGEQTARWLEMRLDATSGEVLEGPIVGS